ncbi:unnamed protein product [Somion occarium]|uniref:Cation efflux protein transmembrane domain-containing protein n=1 Tax=Somion occarium TaxID=3059160 RepID=A0ABP1E6T9_9APHY
MDVLKRGKAARSAATPHSLEAAVVSNIAFVLTLHAGKQYLNSDIGFHRTLSGVLVCVVIAYAARVWARGERINAPSSPRATLLAAACLMYVNGLTLLFALAALPVTRIIILSQTFALLRTCYQAGRWLSLVTSVIALLASFASDLQSLELSSLAVLCAYCAIALQAACFKSFINIQSQAAHFVDRLMVNLTSLSGALGLCTTIHLLALLVGITPGPLFVIPTGGELLLALPLLASLIPHSFGSGLPIRGSLFVQHLSPCLATLALGPLLYKEHIGGLDLMAASCALYGMYSQESRGTESLVQLIQSYLHSILENPESRKIFYFLMLNMCYMLVQMLYGIWTNSLGLISDAIHMAFDCLAIGIGLVASVMAHWPPNEKFTYGYSRIETLSGFSNGIFLILISIFIVFEAVQRLLSPPDMNTSQLLLVSAVGLAVNLFGMFAMGGHHHHGGHSHGHSHAGDPISALSNHPAPMHHDHDLHDHAHSHGHSHTHSHDHNDDHSHTEKVVIPAVNMGPPSDDPDEEPLPYNYDPAEHDLQCSSAGHQHSHSHAHSHGHGHEGHSHNMRGVFLHVMADTLGSVGVIISTVLIQFYGWTGFDPIASLFIAILIAASVVPLIVDTGKVLLLDLADQAGLVDHMLTEIQFKTGSVHFEAKLWPINDSNIVGSLNVTIQKRSGLDSSDGQFGLQNVIDNVNDWMDNRVHGLEEAIVHFSIS